jgi:hypothetical protein
MLVLFTPVSSVVVLKDTVLLFVDLIPQRTLVCGLDVPTVGRCGNEVEVEKHGDEVEVECRGD